jgi:hypothetical protein
LKPNQEEQDETITTATFANGVTFKPKSFLFEKKKKNGEKINMRYEKVVAWDFLFISSLSLFL